MQATAPSAGPALAAAPDGSGALLGVQADRYPVSRRPCWLPDASVYAPMATQDAAAGQATLPSVGPARAPVAAPDGSGASSAVQADACPDTRRPCWSSAVSVYPPMATQDAADAQATSLRAE